MGKHSAETFFQRLAGFDAFFEPLHREMVEWLGKGRLAGARVADVGCGAGGMALLFAEMVGIGGEVAAVEVNGEKLGLLRGRFEKTPFPERISLHVGEIPALPFEDGAFDLVWSSRVVHHVADQVAGVRELVRITKPGGWVAVREGGISPHFLPFELGIGKDGLEERIRAAQSIWYGKMRERENGIPCPLGWMGILREAGLKEVTAKSFLYELLPPFSDAQVGYLGNWLRDYGTHEDVPLSDADRETILAITDPQNEYYVMRRNDLHFLYVGSVYAGAKT